MKIQTKDLTGAALDWAVATAEGLTIDNLMGGAVWAWTKDALTGEDEYVSIFGPSTAWVQGGPIIEREILALIRRPDGSWTADNFSVLTRPQHLLIGPTPLIAAMRCFVASKLGEGVDVPGELT